MNTTTQNKLGHNEAAKNHVEELFIELIAGLQTNHEFISDAGTFDCDERRSGVDYSFSLLSRNDTDSTYHWTDAQTEWSNKTYDACEKTFRNDFDCTLDHAYEHDDFHEYEAEWFGVAYFELHARWCMEKLHFVVYASINYCDGVYGHDAYKDVIGVLPPMSMKELLALTHDRIELDTNTFKLK